MNPTDLPTIGPTVHCGGLDLVFWCHLISREDVQEDDVMAELRSKYQIAVQFVKQKPCFMSREAQQTKNSAPGLDREGHRQTRSSTKKKKKNGELTAEEKHCIKVIQSQSFHSEIDLLKAGKCSNTDWKQDLKPFLDEDELFGVGGRLQHSDLSYREEHPWILPNNHR